MSPARGRPADARPQQLDPGAASATQAGVGAGQVLLAALAWAGLLTATVAPDRLGLADRLGPAQLVALRGLVGLALLLLATGLVAWALRLRRRAAPAGAWSVRSAPGLLTLVATIAVLGAAIEAAVLADRGTTGLLGAEPPPATGEGQVVVLVQNTLTRLDAEALATQILARGADVVVLPETSPTTAELTADLVRSRSGRELQVITHAPGPTDISSTALLVDAELGAFTRTEVLAGNRGSFLAADATGATVVAAVHTTAPADLDLRAWRRTTQAAVAACGRASIVAGDFNATLDHPAMTDLGGCVDAAAVAGTAAVGTWPTALPRVLGAPIDHVLVDPSVWRVVRAAVLEPPPGTDHRAVEAVLTAVDG